MSEDVFYGDLDEVQFKLPDAVINKIVGNRLKERRISMGLNQAELGKKLHVSGQQIHKYEAGTDKLSVAKVHELANILQVPINYFFDELECDHFAESDSDDYQAFGPDELRFWKYVNIYKEFSDPKLQKMLVEVTRLFSNQLKLLELTAQKPQKKSADKKQK